MININEIVSLISLALTVPTVVFGVAVLAIWGKEIVKTFKRGPSNPMEWLITGVVIAFFGSIVDNLYWGFAWSYSYFYGCDIPSHIATIGITMNIFFRQLSGTLAAYCHLRSYTEMKKDDNLNKKLWFSSSIIGVIYVMILSLIKR